jgi:hypothetical protein
VNFLNFNFKKSFSQVVSKYTFKTDSKTCEIKFDPSDIKSSQGSPFFSVSDFYSNRHLIIID